MNRLKQIARNTLNLDIDKILFEIYQDKDLQEFILNLNRKGQLFDKSVDSKNRPLSPGYSPFTENQLESDRANLFRYKGSTRKKKAGDAPFLFDEGEFYETFTVAVKVGFILIEADPIKDDTNLFEKYGVDILGLNQDSIIKLAQRILPKLQELTKQQILS